MNDEQTIHLLNKEYERIENYLRFSHDDRSKYVAFIISLIAGTGITFFVAIKHCEFLIAAAVAILAGFINIFFLRWFADQRAESRYLINKLTAINDQLCQISPVHNINKSYMLNNKYRDDSYSREHEIFRIIIVLFLCDYSAAFYILLCYLFHCAHRLLFLNTLVLAVMAYFLVFNKTKHFCSTRYNNREKDTVLQKLRQKQIIGS